MITTRIGGRDVLYVQSRGISTCSYLRSGVGTPFFCDGPGPCRASAIAGKWARAAIHTSNPVVIDLCAGSFTFRYDTPSGFIESSVDGADAGIGHFRITLLETETSVNFRQETTFAAGVCAS